jgi:hypothetical protein
MICDLERWCAGEAFFQAATRVAHCHVESASRNCCSADAGSLYRPPTVNQSVAKGVESQNLRIGPNVMRRLLCAPLLK